MKPPVWRQNSAAYPHVFILQTRYRDEDRLGHVNNIAVAAYYDEARSRFTGDVVRAATAERVRIVTADSRVTYLAEVFHGADVEIRSGVLRIGSASWDIGQAMFQKGKCVGLCQTTLVQATAAGAQPLADAIRAALTRMLVTEPADA
ncbi:thioesterase [Camelimonas fluminis]|uniref:Acyl-CoA thioesterase n=1 Tax=Camelimonas fluminis TaxID=1576911 RepID=A0ABV7UNZ9_9HYPH|nr:acyl-CoA thioesterase [Camelimonas fluminis]GHE65528.1 thioesterase [Camelimonas fluminis]